MKTLPRKLFPNCSFSPDKDAGFYDITPEGFNHVVSLYLGSGTVKDDDAIAKAADFFDNASEWDVFCRDYFQSVPNDSEDFKEIMAYFSFYKDEVPDVFGVPDVSALTLPDMVKYMKLKGMASHGGYSMSKKSLCHVCQSVSMQSLYQSHSLC